MARTVSENQRSRYSLDAWFFVGGLAGLFTVLAFTRWLGPDLGDSLTRNTVRLSLAWYATSLCLMMRLGSTDWKTETRLGRAARWCWTWAIAVFFIHLGMAFHYFDHWSHAHAFERTRSVSGVGEGLYVSYAFTLMWLADVVAWWVAPARYAARPAWIGRALHGFMLVIVFNGMVVFEKGAIRLVGIVMFTLLACIWLASRRRKRKREDYQMPAAVDAAAT